MDGKQERSPVFMVEDLETLRILTDPLRMEILQILDPEPQSINQVAEKLGLSASRLYYHFKILEEHGLISVVQTRMVNNIVEKFYWLTAEDIDFDKSLFEFSSETGQENVERLVLSYLESTRMDMMRSIQARRTKLVNGAKPIPRDMIIVSSKKRIKDETYQVFIQRLKDLLEEFSTLPEEKSEAEDVNTFSLACFAYPNYYYEERKIENEKE
jgi:DNA-binding transcriptional ArsR family regulator